MRTAILIPAYNEGAHIHDLIAQCKIFLPDILVYDDGSTDNTVAEAKRAGAEVIMHAKNQGKGQTLFDGFDVWSARGFDAVICLDADGQHAPDEIPLFLQAGNNGADLVIGNRMDARKTMPLVNWYTNIVTSLVVSFLTRRRIHDSQVGYRLLKCAAWQKIKSRILSRNFEFESEMLVMAGREKLTLAEVPIKTIYGNEVSKISAWQDTIRFIKMAWRLL